jgi:hypothetical protein
MKLEVWNENAKLQGDTLIGMASFMLDQKSIDKAKSDKGEDFTLPLSQVRRVS